MKDYTNYTKPIDSSNKHYLNISAYPEFFIFCERKNLSLREATILQHILINTKEWEISPTTIAKLIYGEEYTDTKRKNISKSLTNLLNKLSDYISLPKGRSKGGSNGGSILDASKVYNEIYNAITTGKWNNNSSVETTSVNKVNEEKEVTPIEENKDNYDKICSFLNNEETNIEEEMLDINYEETLKAMAKDKKESRNEFDNYNPNNYEISEEPAKENSAIKEEIESLVSKLNPIRKREFELKISYLPIESQIMWLRKVNKLPMLNIVKETTNTIVKQDDTEDLEDICKLI